jgi:hypothetical protein
MKEQTPMWLQASDPNLSASRLDRDRSHRDEELRECSRPADELVGAARARWPQEIL